MSKRERARDMLRFFVRVRIERIVASLPFAIPTRRGGPASGTG
jgi:hypothetical protein